MKKISLFKLILSLLAPLLVGGVSAALTAKGMADYGSMSKPPLAPPAWVFPVAWTVLYLMMGLADYLVWVAETDSHCKGRVMILYWIQLAMNFMWSIVFFNLKWRLPAFIWLMVMWAIVIICACKFGKIDKRAGWLLVPYILWLTFAAYLNMGAYILNR